VKKLAVLLSVISLSALSAFALTLPTPKGYVTDNAGILSSDTILYLENTLKTFQASTSNQIAVVTISKLDNDTIESASESLFKVWGIGGKEKDNGILLLISKEDRKMRIEVGYGLEGALPDILANRIISDEITPKFRTDDYNAGVLAGVSAIIKATEGEYTPEKTTKSSRSWLNGDIIYAILMLLFVGVTALIEYLARSRAWWQGGLVGAGLGSLFGFIFHTGLSVLLGTLILGTLGLIIDYFLSKRGPFQGGGTSGGVWGAGSGPMSWGGFGGGRSGGGFGGFGGGRSGGGGSSGSW